MKAGNVLKIKLIIVFVCFLVFILSAILRSPLMNENFINSDASYHVLLTMTAFKNLDFKEHFFLPLVTINQQSLDIPWGATLASKNGAFFYTSFSSIGFLVPYLIFELLNFDINLLNLFLFNTFLMILSLILLIKLMFNLLQINNSKFNFTIIFIVFFTFLFSPEVMHSLGISYWHHSLFLPLFLTQTLVYFHSKKEPKFLIFFFLLAVVNPIIEWAGFFSNLGFLLAYFISATKTKENRVQTTTYFSLKLILTTLLSIVIYFVHFNFKIEFVDFVLTMFSRLDARSSINLISTYSILFLNYLRSFGAVMVLIVVLSAVVLKLKVLGSLLVKIKTHSEILIILTVLNMENVFLNVHAIDYSFARLKLILLLMFIVVILLLAIEESLHSKFIRISFMGFVLFSSIVSMQYYMGGGHYRWEADYLESNRVIATQLRYVYSETNSIMIHENLATRGYSNLLFNRGIYEYISIDEAIFLAQNQDKRFVIILKADSRPRNMYYYHGYEIIDLYSLKN